MRLLERAWKSGEGSLLELLRERVRVGYGCPVRNRTGTGPEQDHSGVQHGAWPITPF